MDTSKTTKIDRNASVRKLGLNDREVIETKQNAKRSTCGCPFLTHVHLLKEIKWGQVHRAQTTENLSQK
jgi:hypothetical protein